MFQFFYPGKSVGIIHKLSRPYYSLSRILEELSNRLLPSNSHNSHEIVGIFLSLYSKKEYLCSRSHVFQNFIYSILPIFIFMLPVVSKHCVLINKSNKSVCMTCHIRFYLWYHDYFYFEQLFKFRNQLGFAGVFGVFVKNSVGYYCFV